MYYLPAYMTCVAAITSLSSRFPAIRFHRFSQPGGVSRSPRAPPTVGLGARRTRAENRPPELLAVKHRDR